MISVDLYGLFFLKPKDETKTNIINFVSYIENQFHNTLICFRTNNGSELFMHSFFQSKGILHQKSFF